MTGRTDHRDAGSREAWTCRFCGKAFLEPAYLDLHRGRAHDGELTADEKRAYARALHAEEVWLARFQRHVRGGLAALPLPLFYAFLIIVMAAYDANPALALLLAPGVLAFTALIYYLGYTHESAASEL